MGRYSPTVLPEANSTFASALSGLGRGVETGFDLTERVRARRRERQAEEERLADRQRAERERHAEDLAQPGAMSLGTYLARPGIERQLSAGSLQSIANAGEPDATQNLEFTPEAGRRLFQTATGPVVDRDVARKENLANYMQRYIPSYMREGFESPEARTADELKRHPERVASAGRTSAATEGQDADYRKAIAAYPDLKGLSPATAARIYAQRQERDYSIAHPLPTRPGAGTTPTDRRTAALQRELANAQADVQRLETMPEAAGRTGDRLPAGVTQEAYDRWSARYRTAVARQSRAQRDVNSTLYPSGGTPNRPAPQRRALPSLPPLPD